MWWKSPSLYSFLIQAIRRVWRYQRGNQKPLIEIPKIDKQHEEGETTQWQKKKDTRTNGDLQNITPKTKDRATRTPLKTDRAWEYEIHK